MRPLVEPPEQAWREPGTVAKVVQKVRQEFGTFLFHQSADYPHLGHRRAGTLPPGFATVWGEGGEEGMDGEMWVHMLYKYIYSAVQCVYCTELEF
jgi:hypothetical protein